MPEHRVLPWYDRLWWETVSNQRAPILGKGTAQEKDRPWRSAEYVNIRIPKTGLVLAVGVWGRPHPTEVDDDDGSEYLDLRTLEWDEVFGEEADEDDDIATGAPRSLGEGPQTSPPPHGTRRRHRLGSNLERHLDRRKRASKGQSPAG